MMWPLDKSSSDDRPKLRKFDEIRGALERGIKRRIWQRICRGDLRFLFQRQRDQDNAISKMKDCLGYLAEAREKYVANGGELLGEFLLTYVAAEVAELSPLMS